MTMFDSLTRSLTLAALLALPPAWCAPASAQDAPAPKDDALDGLLKKIEEKGKDAKPADKPAPAPEKDAGGKTSGEVSGKDKDLDSLLEKLGTTEDKPSPDDKRGGAGGRDEPPPPDKPGQGKEKDKDKKPDPNELSGKDRDLDEHIGELAGKRRKKNDRDKGEDGGPLSQVIKEMREVEQRLGKTDTGEETRKKQGQIVKQIETMIEQARSSSSRSKGKPRPGKPQPGEQPGQQLSGNPGTTGGNAPFTKPLKPNAKASALAGKDEWGHLPPELRQEMENVFKEEPLRSREELIRRYYLSVSKKALTRGE